MAEKIMLYLLSYPDLNHSLLIFLVLLFVLFYEAINGFHDTANSVSTLIYTRSMSARSSVIMSGIFNFFGVIFGGLTVAYAIVHLLPNDLLFNANANRSLAMIFSMLLSCTIWNLSTWYFGLPASSSHSLIGAIIGVGLTHSAITGSSLIYALNLPKINSIFLSLIFSPIAGLIIAGSIIFLLRHYLHCKFFHRIHMTPLEREKIDHKISPPLLIRIMLIISSIGVSYTHGSNDGQKGVGLIMLVLIALIPNAFLLDLDFNKNDILHTKITIEKLEQYYYKNFIKLPVLSKHKIEKKDLVKNSQLHQMMQNIHQSKFLLQNLSCYNQLTVQNKYALRHFLSSISDCIDYTIDVFQINSQDKLFLTESKKDLLKSIEYAPVWIILIIALSLSIGTMIGWKRVVITIGEKIGKKSMTYAQAVSAQMTAACSIGIASYTGVPVSTTHILSSSVAGTMLVDGDGVQIKTIKNVFLAWILTLPVSMILSGFFYRLSLFII